MLFCLAEALDSEQDQLNAAYQAVIAIEAKGAQQCAALRHEIFWEDISHHLLVRHYGLIERPNIQVAKHGD